MVITLIPPLWTDRDDCVYFFVNFENI
ncbi:unnamed protein product, partial [Rotaria sp. Silwood1]